MQKNFKKAIHLLYVPTIFCNMACKYCYLGELTEQRPNNEQAISTLNYALEQLLAAGYLPFNLSFHGGEVTTLPSDTLKQLFEIAKNYYQDYADAIKNNGFKINPIHIKTNLLNFTKHYTLLDDFEVSISASIDLPLNLHGEYRVDKKGQSTLGRIIDNLKLLVRYPHKKKISCVVTKQHLVNIDEFIKDIWFLHNEINLDMNRFNIMFSFDSAENKAKYSDSDPSLAMLTGAEQLQFYQYLKQAFTGTSLEYGLKTEWFCEFTPDYCCSAVNCGSKFFLLQFDGKVYSCPRGQSSMQYYYGNVFQDEIKSIVNNAWQVIERNENQMDLSDDCLQCSYIHYCHAGCTFVRSETGLRKSYTCDLQKAMYADNPILYPPMPKANVANYIKPILFKNNLHKIKETTSRKTTSVTPELVAPENSLEALIKADATLAAIYSQELFYLRHNATKSKLDSPILKNNHELLFISNNSTLVLGVHESVFHLATDEEVNNHLLLMLLRGTLVKYGDEQRTKQEHILDYAIYTPSFRQLAKQVGAFFELNLMPFILNNQAFYQKDIVNNLFITTKALREYHYAKQRKNAFYHIQAINLPFPNIEFYWLGEVL